jgi:two-component system chemotaxis response regulator CheY
MNKILIVDDARFMRLNLTNILKEDFEIVGEAENGEEAVELYKKLNPDLVTLDITMPVKDGLEALKEIIEYDKNAKVVMCSAMGQKKMVVDAVKSGAKDFLVKPFQKEKAIESLKKLV